MNNRIDFSGIKGFEKDTLDESLSTALSGTGCNLLLDDPNFSIFTPEIGRIELELLKARKLGDKVSAEKCNQKLIIIGLLEDNFRHLNAPSFSINETVDYILKNGIEILIQKFKRDKIDLQVDRHESYGGLTKNEQKINYDNGVSRLIHVLLKKVDLVTITGGQLLELGFLLKYIDKDIQDEPYFDYGGKNIPITAKDTNQARELILMRKSAIKKGIEIGFTTKNVDYFKQLGDDCIRLGTIIDDLEQFIALNELSPGYEPVDEVYNKKELH